MTPSPRIEVECWFRSDPLGLAERGQRRVRDRLAALEGRPGLDSITIHEWPDKLALAGPGPTDAAAKEAVDEFEAWADASDRDLSPAFGTRACYDWTTGDRYLALVLPVASLAVRRDGELTNVYPHVADVAEHSVFDGLDRLERELETREDRDTAEPVPAE